jgi:8-oxo-dGTP pyrophosphatase MutT (NUDIX family)
MTDYKSYSVPISVKGVVFDDGKVWLRKNPRQEWELPGGKLDEGEQPEQTIVRELKEELGFDVVPKGLVGAHLYIIQESIDESRGVFVITYLCSLLDKTGEFEYEGEAGKAEFQSFDSKEIANLNMPKFYKEAISVARQQL